MNFNSNKVNLPRSVTMELRDKYKMCDEERSTSLSCHAKANTLAFKSQETV